MYQFVTGYTPVKSSPGANVIKLFVAVIYKLL